MLKKWLQKISLREISDKKNSDWKKFGLKKYGLNEFSPKKLQLKIFGLLLPKTFSSQNISPYFAQ